MVSLIKASSLVRKGRATLVLIINMLEGKAHISQCVINSESI